MCRPCPAMSRLADLGAAHLMPGAVPATYNVVPVAQCKIPVRMFACGGVEGRIADAAVGCHRQDLFDAPLGVIPEFHPVRQILPAGGRLVETGDPAGSLVRVIVR